MREQATAERPPAVKFSYAFQPIVDTVDREIFSYEALIRGDTGGSAGSVFARVPAASLHDFDRESRLAAVRLAGALGVQTYLNVNVLPRSMGSSETQLRELLAAAEEVEVPAHRLILEVTESEAIDDAVYFSEIIDEYRAMGMMIGIDDFGAGFSGLNMLADFQPDIIKLDMNLLRGIESHGPRQSIVRGIGLVCRELGIDVIAEGVETVAEYRWCADEGIRLFQGYLFARPGFECLPAAEFPL